MEDLFKKVLQSKGKDIELEFNGKKVHETSKKYRYRQREPLKNIRYRIKKMSEKDQLFETKVHLEKQNDDTQKKIEHVQTEINYLKNLLCQVLLTKGILS